MSMNAVPTVAGGGEPPYDKDMDRRLTLLETRFDTILPTLATKGDMEALRAEFHSDFGRQRVEHEKLRGECEKFCGEMLFALEKSKGEVLKALQETTKWFAALAITAIISIFGMGFAMLNAVNNIESRMAHLATLAKTSPALPAPPAVSARKSQ
jgi:hypothetical protein